MARVSIRMPEELGSGSGSGQTTSDAAQTECTLAPRTDGAGESKPVILRWFATWARGEPGRTELTN